MKKPMMEEWLSGIGSRFAAWSGAALFTLLLLAAFAPRAEATVVASGGTMSSCLQNGTNYVIHTFTTPGTSNLSFSAGGNVEVLVVGGGGGGGKAETNVRGDGAGGGGAGGYVYSNSFAVVAGSNYTVTVGGGGGGSINIATLAASYSGSNSVFGDIIAYGGGGGGSDNQDYAITNKGASGGSGGGAASYATGTPATETNTLGGAGTTGQGNAGGGSDAGLTKRGGGGGGGATAAGTTATSAVGGAGGAGTANSISGSSVTYAGGGGGGGQYVATTAQLGGTGGGGGGGGGGSNGLSGANGTANTGGGGGGGSSTNFGSGGISGDGGNGGSGIVIVRYAATPTPSQMQITFGGYTNRSEVLTNFPVLVVFSNGVNNSGFHYGYFAGTNGYDLRFATNSTPPATGLNYEIESWNPNGASYVWVQVPIIPTNGQGAIWANWGNTSASNQLPCTTNGTTWTNQYAAVYHLATTGGVVSAADATTVNNGGVNGTVTAVTGLMDGGAQITTATGNNAVRISNSASLQITNRLTLSAWVNLTTWNANGSSIIEKRAIASTSSENYGMWVQSDGKLNFERQNPVGAYQQLYSGAGVVPTNRWVYLTLAIDENNSAAMCKMYVNGSEVSNHTIAAYSTTNMLATGTDPVQLGNYYSTAFGNGQFYLNGSMDEARISPRTHSSNWVWACYQTMASNTAFSSYGAMSAVVPPTITVGTNFLDFGNSVSVNTTNTLTNTVSGVGLSADITVTLGPWPTFQMSTNNVDFTNTYTLVQTGGTVPTTTNYVRFIPTGVGPHAGVLTNISGSVTQTVTLVGTGVAAGAPTLYISGGSLAFGNVITNKSSTNSYTLSGSNLTADVAVTAPTHYQIATNGGIYGQTLTLTTNTPGTLDTTTINVKFMPTNGPGAAQYAGYITNSTAGVTNTVSLTGTGVVQGISVSAVTSCGTVILPASSTNSFTVSGSNLEDNVIVTVPTSAFTVSTNATGSFGSSCTVLVAGVSAPSGANLASTLVYVKFTPPGVGSYSTNITCSSVGAVSQTNTPSGTGVMPPVTVSITAPSANQLFNIGDSVTLTATVVPGTPSYWVNIYTNRFSGSYGLASSQSGAGPSFPVSLGSSLVAGTYHAYATVTDSVSSVTYTSAVSAFVVQPAVPAKMLASGGDVTFMYTNNAGTSSQIVYGVHQYTNADVAAFVPNAGVTNVDYLIVGGGGGGAQFAGAGGGGGGGIVKTGTLSSLSAQPYSLIVGAGGAGGTTGDGGDGGTSTFSTVSASGGGGGGGYGGSGHSIGNGGGAGGSGSGTGGTGTDGGKNGGAANTGAAGGGGGMDANGFAAPSASAGGNGGYGRTNSITGTPTPYGGGGGGGARTTSAGTAGSGGAGGGGTGGYYNGSGSSSGVIAPIAGTANTGGGGGGAGGCLPQPTWTMNGGNGGSGVVIVRYVIPPPPKGSVFILR